MIETSCEREREREREREEREEGERIATVFFQIK